MYTINIDEDNRILRVGFEEYAEPDSILVEKRPEDLVPVDATEKEKDARNWLYIDGEYIYDPLPEKPDPEAQPSQLDLIEAQVTYTAMMTDTLLEV